MNNSLGYCVDGVGVLADVYTRVADPSSRCFEMTIVWPGHPPIMYQKKNFSGVVPRSCTKHARNLMILDKPLEAYLNENESSIQYIPWKLNKSMNFVSIIKIANSTGQVC